jgi:hypothetical protein
MPCLNQIRAALLPNGAIHIYTRRVEISNDAILPMTSNRIASPLYGENQWSCVMAFNNLGHLTFLAVGQDAWWW